MSFIIVSKPRSGSRLESCRPHEVKSVFNLAVPDSFARKIGDALVCLGSLDSKVAVKQGITIHYETVG